MMFSSLTSVSCRALGLLVRAHSPSTRTRPLGSARYIPTHGWCVMKNVLIDFCLQGPIRLRNPEPRKTGTGGLRKGSPQRVQQCAQKESLSSCKSLHSSKTQGRGAFTPGWFREEQSGLPSGITSSTCSRTTCREDPTHNRTHTIGL